MLGLLAERLAFLRAVDAVPADAYRAVVVQDFEGVAVGSGNDGVGLDGSTVIGIPAYFEIDPCGSSETDEREHES
jgi:hypothetical protein